MAEARALNFFTKRDYIKSSQRDDKSSLKGAWFCSRDLSGHLALVKRCPDGIMTVMRLAKTSLLCMTVKRMASA